MTAAKETVSGEFDKAWWDDLKAKLTPAGGKAPSNTTILRDMATVFNWVVNETVDSGRAIVSAEQDGQGCKRLALPSLEKLTSQGKPPAP